MESEKETHWEITNLTSTSRHQAQTCALKGSSSKHCFRNCAPSMPTQSKKVSRKIDDLKNCRRDTTVTCKVRRVMDPNTCRKSIVRRLTPNSSKSFVFVFIVHLFLTHAHAAKNFHGLSRSEVSKEILSLFGFSRTPHPVGHPARERQNDAAPLYMLGLYNSLSGFSELFDDRIKEGSENPSDPNVAHKRDAPTTPRQMASFSKHSSGPFSHTYPYDVRIATNSAWYRYSEAQMVFQNEIGVPDRDEYSNDEYRFGYDSMMSDGLEHNLLKEADVVMSITATNRAYSDDVKGAGTLLKRHRPFYFNVSQIPEEDKLIAAKFRLYKNIAQESQENTTLRVNVYQALYDKSGRTELHLLESRRVRSIEEGWLVFDVTSACKDWILSPDDNLGLRVAVETLRGRSQNLKKAGIVGKRKDLSKQAFLVSFLTQGIEALPRQARERMRRGVERDDAMYEEESNQTAFKEETVDELDVDDELDVEDINEPQKSKRAKKGRNRGRAGRKERNQIHTDRKDEGDVACHREALYVDFRQLTWDGWIIAPAGYLAYQCLGTCRFPLSEKMNATNHAIVQTLMHVTTKKKVPRTCCSPTELAAISVLYYNDNNNVIFKKYKNMVVEACGCR